MRGGVRPALRDLSQLQVLQGQAAPVRGGYLSYPYSIEVHSSFDWRVKVLYALKFLVYLAVCVSQLYLLHSLRHVIAEKRRVSPRSI